VSEQYKYILKYSGEPDLTLDEAPANWDKLGISYERNEFYHGIIRYFSLSLKFGRKDGLGGEYIITAYENDGIAALVEIEIYERNPQTYDFDIYFTGMLDFSPSRFSIERDSVEIAIIDGSKEQRFMARDEINYDINSVVSQDDITVDSFVSSPKDITFKPIDIYLGCESNGVFNKIQGLFEVGWQLKLSYQGETSKNEIRDRVKINDELKYAIRKLSVDPEYNELFIIYTNETDNDTRILLDFVDIDLSLITLFVEQSQPNTAQLSSNIFISIIDESGNYVKSTPLTGLATDRYDNISPSQSDTKTLSFSDSDLMDETIEPGWSVILFTIASYSGASTNVTANFTTNHVVNDLGFTEVSLGEPEETIVSYLPHEAFTRLIQLMTSETDETKLFYSEFLGRTDSEFVTYLNNGEGALDAITTGWNLRKFPNRAFNLNMRDLFQTFASIYNLGMGFDRSNDRFYIAEIQDFYNPGYFMFDLGEVKEMVIKPYKEGYFSQILSGYGNKVEYEDFQGVNEYNVPTEHAITIPIPDKYIANTKYNSDSVGMELARRFPYSSDASKDTKYDENIYTVRTDGSETIQGGTNLSGFEGIENWYNIAITPRENLIRFSPQIKAALWKSDIFVKFIKSQKDLNVTYDNQNGDNVNEQDDIQVSELTSEALFIPEIYELDGILTGEMISILNTDPHGYVTWTFNGVDYEAFILRTEGSDYEKQVKWILIGKEKSEGRNLIYENNDNFVFENDNNTILEE